MHVLKSLFICSVKCQLTALKVLRHGNSQCLNLLCLEVIKYTGSEKYYAILRTEINLVKPGYIIKVACNICLPLPVTKQLIPHLYGVREIQVVRPCLSVVHLPEGGVKTTSQIDNTGLWVLLKISLADSSHVVLSGSRHDGSRLLHYPLLLICY